MLPTRDSLKMENKGMEKRYFMQLGWAGPLGCYWDQGGLISTSRRLDKTLRDDEDCEGLGGHIGPMGNQRQWGKDSWDLDTKDKVI